ncbi:MAG: Uma2 family endonuclease [Cyanothece sp. SIO1E1]|nr:Uma2 family endonuclease [Cyanothece sp. SIO1E1]
MIQVPVKPAQWTIQRYHQAVEAGILANWNVELLDGVIVEMSPEGPLHAGKIDSAKDTTGEKYQTYAKEGIEDYWVFNLQDQTLKVHRNPQDGEYLDQQTLTSGIIKPLTLDIDIDVAKLLGRRQNLSA